MSRTCRGNLGFAPISTYLGQEGYRWRHQANYFRKRLHLKNGMLIPILARDSVIALLT